MSEERETPKRVIRVLGELALIFLGITAALWFEDMNASRHERALETQILREMSTSITADTVDLHINLRVGDSILVSIDTVLARLAAAAPYDPGLADHFGRTSRYVRFFHNPAAYEHLRSAGFDVVSDDDLRQAIIAYYDQSVPLVTWLDQALVVNHRDSYVMPQMMSKFVYEAPFQTATPVDFGALKDDVEYQNALRLIAFSVEAQMDVTRRAVDRADTLLRTIESALSVR